MSTPIPLKEINLEKARTDAVNGILDTAREEEYDTVVVLGIKGELSHILSSPISDQELVWLLEITKMSILQRSAVD